jgi:hypothetical protein
VADIDHDGAPEIVASTDTLDPRADAMIVFTWNGQNTLTERYRLPVPSGVQALAVCPSVDGGLRPIALATTRAVWIIR